VFHGIFDGKQFRHSEPHMAFQKNGNQAAKLTALSKEVNLNVRDMMLSDEHLDKVCPIFYEGLPKLARMSMSREKFKVFYINQRVKLADQMFPQAKATA
jgi:hypothetical protein